MDTTSNPSVYKKARRQIVLGCAHCRAHRGCNNHVWYGLVKSAKIEEEFNLKKIKHPSWKIISKNKKQWMNKPSSFRIIEKYSEKGNYKFYSKEIKF